MERGEPRRRTVLGVNEGDGHTICGGANELTKRLRSAALRADADLDMSARRVLRSLTGGCHCRHRRRRRRHSWSLYWLARIAQAQAEPQTDRASTHAGTCYERTLDKSLIEARVCGVSAA